MSYLIHIFVVAKPDQSKVTSLNLEKQNSSPSGMEVRGFVSYTSSDITELYFSLYRSEYACTFL